MEDNQVQYIESALLQTMDPSSVGDCIETEKFVQLSVPFAKTHHRNGIFKSKFESPSELQTHIEEAKAHFAELETAFRWVIGPWSKPLDSEAILRSHGFVHSMTTAGMILDVSKFTIQSWNQIQINEIGEEEIPRWSQVLADGYGLTEDALGRINWELNYEFSLTPPRTYYFVSSGDQEDAGASSIMFLDGLAHMAGAVVKTKFRKQGHYRAMVHGRAKLAQEHKITHITTFCDAEKMAPICEKVGFEKVCEMKIFVFDSNQ